MNAKRQFYRLLEENEDTIRSCGVSRLGLFGSIVREEETKTSDIDILVEFHTGKKNYDNFINLCYFLEDSLKRKVDLLTPEGISPIIKQSIEKEIEYVQIPI